MTFRRRLTSKQRQQLYDSEAEKAREAGLGEFPICNICGTPIIAGSLWDESHDPLKARWLGGTATACAHRRCNRLHGHLETRRFAKSERVRKRYLDITRSRTPMQGGRDDSIQKKVSGKVVLRETGERP